MVLLLWGMLVTCALSVVDATDKIFMICTTGVELGSLRAKIGDLFAGQG